MFDFIHNQKTLLKIILAIALLPFLFWGVDSYFRFTGPAQFAAKVDGATISQQAFNTELRERQNDLRRVLGGDADRSLLNSPQLRISVLDGMVRDQLLVSRAVQAGLVITDNQLREFISEAPVFQDKGKFSSARYDQFLRQRGMTAPMFENRLRHDLLMQELTSTYAGTGFVPKAVVDRLIRINEQGREVAQADIATDPFVAQVKLAPDAAKKYYDSHPAKFEVPEQAKLHYLVLSLDEVAAQMPVSADEVKQYYDQHQSQYTQPEEREASHILIAVASDASADQKKQAHDKAEQIYQQVKKDPGSFADLAKKYSQDPGSAANGGNLGFFQRGDMVKPFADAVFNPAAKVGDIIGPVQTQYGYHIIRLDAVRPGKQLTLDDVRPQIEAELKKQAAGRKFAEEAESFNNLVYEQSDTLQPAAKALKLKVQESPWIASTGTDVKPLNNPKLLKAVFSNDVLKNKRNTDVIEVAPNTLVAARVADYKPAAKRPFSEVKDAIDKQLTQQQASQLAVKEGKAKLAQLKAGKEASVKWGKAQVVSLKEPNGTDRVLLRTIASADVTKLPAYTGVENAKGGYTLVKITRVIDPPAPTDEQRVHYAQQLDQLLARQEVGAYITSLKQQAKIKINQSLMQGNEQGEE
ncbi:MAG TPA: SurA N-terminal domain-containing protein [Burkholderiales bacterium]|nr:SurA N-terminal domain-containing protein [Burkholderiales bacterium]